MTATLEPVEGASVTEAPTPSRIGGRVRDLLALLVALALLVPVGAAFAGPWVDRGDPAGSDLQRFGRAPNGDSWLQVERDADGVETAWTAGNTIVQPGFRAILRWPLAPRDALQALADPEGDAEATETAALARLEAYEGRSRTIAPDGAITEQITYSVLTEDELLLIGLGFGGNEGEVMFDPPVPLLGTDLSPGTTLTAEGTLGDSDYRSERRVEERGPATAALGTFEDCVIIHSDLIVTRDGEEVLRNVGTETWCAGQGTVETSLQDPDSGEVTSTAEVVASSRIDMPVDWPALPAASESAPTEDQSGAPADWAWTRHGRVRDAAEATIPPTFVDAAEPLVLTAALDDDLVAFHADSVGEEPAWRFRTGGSVHSPPLHDPASGRIFFGSTDRHVYALDERGLFQWAAPTSDNVASRPALVDDVLVVGSEDGDVHGLDAADGTSRWRVATGGPVVSSPVVVGDLVAIGSDDGAVRAIEAASGDVRWVQDLGDPVTGPLAATADGVVVAPTTGGTVVGLDAADGEVRWEANAPWSLRAAPLVVGDTVVVIDDGGNVLALDAATGEERWQVDAGAVGTAAAVDDAQVAMTSEDGRVQLLEVATGEIAQVWDANEVRGAMDGAVEFSFGPTMTPFGLWAVDDATVLLRLAGASGATGSDGQPVPAEARLVPAWLAVPFEEPWIAGDVPASTPLEHAGRFLMLEMTGRVFAIDPASGATELLGAIEIDDRGLFADGVVDGDRLYVASGSVLHAVDLPSLEPAWQFEGEDLSARPPVVAGDAVVWVSEPATEDDEDPVPVLSVLDAADGTLRWSAPLANDATLTGATVGGDTVYTASGAFDLATGDVVWTSPLELPGTGSPALSEDGSTLFVSMLSEQDEENGIAALDAATGEVLWRSAAPAMALTPMGTPWPYGDVVVIPTLEGYVVGLDAATGAHRWRFDPPHPVLGTITLDEGLVWMATENAAAIALDAASGAVRYRMDDLDTPVHHYARAQRPGRAGDHMGFAIGFYVFAFDLTAAP